MLILASRSPRRTELLRQMGIEHDAEPADIDESPADGESPEAYVERISCAKAEAIRQRFPGRPILAADTAVVIDGLILGQPLDRDDAVRMLLRLSGRTHRVLTGVAVFGDSLEYRLSCTEVDFTALDAAKAQAYWDTGEPRDKAGAYAIQGVGAAFVTEMRGSCSGVIGLPLKETLEMLSQIGIYGRLGV